MRDETLHTAERLGEREVFEVRNELAHGIVTAFQLDTDDRAKAGLLAARDVMSGVARQTGVVHTLHAGLLVQPLRQAHGVAAMMIQTRVQSAQAAQGQEAVERSAGDAEAVRPPYELLM